MIPDEESKAGDDRGATPGTARGATPGDDRGAATLPNGDGATLPNGDGGQTSQGHGDGHSAGAVDRPGGLDRDGTPSHGANGAGGPAIVVNDLVKHYGEVEAVKGVRFEVAAGEVFGFLGPNGAGKTTTISMLCTLVKPTSGSATVAGHDVVNERDDVRRNIGLVFQDPTLDNYLSAEQNLRLHAELYGLQRDLVRPRMQQVLEMVGLWERKDSPVGTFSGGMRRRLEIARGMMHSPRVLFLDEPTIGLDPQTRRSIWSYIAELKEREDITIFMTTHYMDEAEWCDRIAIMDNGEIVALDPPAQLKAEIGKDRVMIHTDDDEEAITALRERFGIEAGMAEGAVTFGVAGGEEFVPRLFAELGVPIRGVSVSRPTLDDVFMAHTGTTIRDAEEDAGRNRSRMMMQMMHGGRR